MSLMSTTSTPTALSDVRDETTTSSQLRRAYQHDDRAVLTVYDVSKKHHSARGCRGVDKDEIII